jgi:hypothetical protein
VRIDRVDDGRRISFAWWPVSQPDRASAVDLVVLPASHGSVLEIVETFPARTTVSAAATTAWSSRVRVLGAMRVLVAA